MSSKLLKNSLYNSIAGVNRIVLRIITVPILIRILGIEKYGIWAIITSVIGLVIAMEAGLPAATTIFISRDLEEKSSIELSQSLTILLLFILSLATTATIGIREFTHYIALSLPDIDKYQIQTIEQALQISSIVIWSRLIQQVIIGIEQAYEKYATINIINTIYVVLDSIGLLALASFTGKIMLMIQYQAVISIIFLSLHCIYSFRLLNEFQLQFMWNSDKARRIVSFSMSAWLANLGGIIFSQVDRLLIGSTLGVSSLGIYAAITNITAQINQLSAMPVQPILPILSRTTANKTSNLQNIQDKIRKLFSINCLVAFFLGSTLLVLAPEILVFTFKDNVSSTSIISFRIATIIYTLYSLNAVGYYICLGSNKVNVVMYTQIVSGIFSVLLIYFGSKRYGLMGGLIGNIGYLGVFLLSLKGFSNLGINFTKWLKWMLHPLVAFLLLTAVILYFPQLNIYPNSFIVLILFLAYLGFSILTINFNLNLKLILDMSSLKSPQKFISKLVVRAKMLQWKVVSTFNKNEIKTFKLPDNSLFKYPLNSAIGCCLYRGSFEEQELSFFMSTLKPGDTVLDVGANAGLYSIIASKIVGEEGHIYAFEPGEVELSLLAENIALNQSSNIQVVDKAVGNYVGEVNLGISDDGAMNSLRVTQHSMQNIKQWTSVQITTLDEFIKHSSIAKVDFIKIDVEGAEYLVLEGAKEVLTNNKLTILFESSNVTSAAFEESISDIIQYVQRIGFSVYYLDEHSNLTQVLETTQDIGGKIYNFIAKNW